MIYLTDENNKINIDSNGYISEGKQGKVFRLDESTCAKIYGDDTTKFDIDVFNYLRKLNLEGYCKLYNLLYSLDKKDIKGYTMKYYLEESENILKLDSKFTIKNFLKLYKGASYLANNQILTKDTIPANSIMTENGIVLIDLDAFSKTNLSIDTCLEVNTNNILYLFRKLFERDIQKLGIQIDDETKLYLDDLFGYGPNSADNFVKKLSYTSTPMDILPFKYRYR